MAVLGTLGAVPAYAQAVRVGAARVDMTPGVGDLPYAPSATPSLNLAADERPFVGVHDPLYARALVADDGHRRIALVVLDVTAVPDAAAIVASVARAIGAAPRDVTVVATHTHNVPLFSYAGSKPSPREEREIARIRDAAVAAARGAITAMAPARIAFGRGKVWVSVNNGEQAGSRAGYDPDGPSDRTVAVIRFTRDDGHPIAEIVNFASHAEVMFRSITRDGGYEITGDLPGAAARLLEAAPDGAPVVLFTAGAEADQLSLYKSRVPAGRLPAVDLGAAGWTLLDVQARRVAEAALLAADTMPAPVPLMRISTASGSTVCPGQVIRIAPATHAVTAVAAPDVTIPLATVRFNDILIGAVGGDVATEIGQRYKADAPLPDTIMITMLAPSVGYIFADASYAHPGHGLTSRCSRRAVPSQGS